MQFDGDVHPTGLPWSKAAGMGTSHLNSRLPPGTVLRPGGRCLALQGLYITHYFNLF